MLSLRNSVKSLNAVLGSVKLHTSVERYGPKGGQSGKKKPKGWDWTWIKPKYWYRPPPQPGVKYVKPYPLEPAEEEHPYRQERWTDWRMKKDYLRRQCVIKLGRQRMMLDTIHKNSILPVELRDLAEREVQETLPRDSSHERLVARCSLTSRPRATTEPWRVGRMPFRHLADYNKLAGVQRALW